MHLLNEITDPKLLNKINQTISDYSFPVKSEEPEYEINLKVGDAVSINDFVATRANSIWGHDKQFERLFGVFLQYSNYPGSVSKISKKTIRNTGKIIWTITVKYPDKKKINISNSRLLRKES